MSRSMAAWRSPTSTATPWEMLGPPEPGMRSRRAPKARVPPVPRLCTPFTSRVAMPAILRTTPSAIEVLPWAVTSSVLELEPDWERALERASSPALVVAPLLVSGVVLLIPQSPLIGASDRITARAVPPDTRMIHPSLSVVYEVHCVTDVTVLGTLD